MEHQFEPIDADIVLDVVNNWDLPSSVMCIIRATHKQTGKIKEYSYQRPKPAVACIGKLLQDHDILVMDHDNIGTVHYNE